MTKLDAFKLMQAYAKHDDNAKEISIYFENNDAESPFAIIDEKFKSAVCIHPNFDDAFEDDEYSEMYEHIFDSQLSATFEQMLYMLEPFSINFGVYDFGIELDALCPRTAHIVFNITYYYSGEFDFCLDADN